MRKIPVIFFDRVHPQNESTSIVIDNYGAGYNITKHLIEQGFRRIMHLGGNVLRNVYKQRLEGYRQALKDYNLPVLKNLHLASALSEEDGTDIARVPTDPRINQLSLTCFERVRACRHLIISFI